MCVSVYDSLQIYTIHLFYCRKVGGFGPFSFLLEKSLGRKDFRIEPQYANRTKKNL
jgi:hypothetical protein